MYSVCRRRNEASHAALIDASSRRAAMGGPEGTVRFPAVSLLPLNPDTFVATTTWLLHSGLALIQVPTISSVRPGFHPAAEDGTGYLW